MDETDELLREDPISSAKHPRQEEPRSECDLASDEIPRHEEDVQIENSSLSRHEIRIPYKEWEENMRLIKQFARKMQGEEEKNGGKRLRNYLLKHESEKIVL